MVSSITREPAKPITAPGSARVTSPNMAKEAVTPPVVGSVSRTTYGRPPSLTICTAITVRGICISERIPSCMRAPPEAGMAMKAACRSTAARAAMTKPSPTATPMEPPMKRKSKAAITADWPPISPTAI